MFRRLARQQYGIQSDEHLSKNNSDLDCGSLLPLFLSSPLLSVWRDLYQNLPNSRLLEKKRQQAAAVQVGVYLDPDDGLCAVTGRG
ncbi:MAG: hypothetical protein FJ267_01405 [Planctomycetes bacterium]|nr:hypothetical protein [Planctomycetota bacterium]